MHIYLQLFVISGVLTGGINAYGENTVIMVGVTSPAPVSAMDCQGAGAALMVKTKLKPYETTHDNIGTDVFPSAPAQFTDAVSVGCHNSAAFGPTFQLIVVDQPVCPAAVTNAVVGDDVKLKCTQAYGGAVPPKLAWTDGASAPVTGGIEVVTFDSVEHEITVTSATPGDTIYTCTASMPTPWPLTKNGNDAFVPKMPAGISPCKTTVTFVAATTTTAPTPVVCPTTAPIPVPVPAPQPPTTPAPPATPPATVATITQSCPTSAETGKACTSATVAVGVVGGMITLIVLYWAIFRNPVQPAAAALSQPAFAQPFYRPLQPMSYVHRGVPTGFPRYRNEWGRRRRSHRYF